MSAKTYTLRSYEASDEDAAIELWRRTWQAAYAHLDFSARTDWWRERWRKELIPQATIVVAETAGTLFGFMTVEPESGYLDQIVVAPECWGTELASLLLDEAKRISPGRLDLLVNKDNARAIRFYEKHGFKYAGDDVNPVSGRPVNRMTWRA
ncbi:MAG TPA: GNAT family N-acetyltransferase [Xanthobacteraceae bacterium]|nr:GNAT family N-acetyltransferase [Xanthobacteraceae bacterium]